MHVVWTLSSIISPTYEQYFLGISRHNECLIYMKLGMMNLQDRSAVVKMKFLSRVVPHYGGELEQLTLFHGIISSKLIQLFLFFF